MLVDRFSTRLNDSPNEIQGPASEVLRVDSELMLRWLGRLGRKTRRCDLDRSVHDWPSFHINSV